MKGSIIDVPESNGHQVVLSAVIASNVEREREREREREVREGGESGRPHFGLWSHPVMAHASHQIKKSKCGICCNKARAMGERAERMA